MNAPASIIILLPFDAGSPKEARRFRPGPYPAKPRKAHWPLNQPAFTPPADQIAEIRRRSQEMLAAVRAQRR